MMAMLMAMMIMVDGFPHSLVTIRVSSGKASKAEANPVQPDGTDSKEEAKRGQESGPHSWNGKITGVEKVSIC